MTLLYLQIVLVLRHKGYLKAYHTHCSQSFQCDIMLSVVTMPADFTPHLASAPLCQCLYDIPEYQLC